MIKLLNGDCLEQMKTLPDNSVDAIVSDPPYGINFMAKKWDYDIPKVEVWEEAMRVLKPGGHALIACGTRTQHRMVCNIEDAGFEIRDVVSWIYGSGFPKSLNVSKAIDKAAGAERDVVGKSKGAASQNTESLGKFAPEYDATAPATEAAKQWDGWGTALKPACEFFTLARKPLSEKTVAANVLKWGTGGINIDGCRVETEDNLDGGKTSKDYVGCGGGWHRPFQDDKSRMAERAAIEREKVEKAMALGRFPSNLIHDGSQEVLDLFPETGKESAARFFYCAKASKKDRGDGNNHPTVKPTALMQYLCRLITPPGGIVLDPYMGSGSTGKAAIEEGFDFIGCELDPDYYKIACARVAQASEGGTGE